MEEPIFISGLRKSGTSMVKGLLDNHPELFVYPPNELHLFRFSHHPAIVKDKQARESDPNELKNIIANQHFITRLNDSTFQYFTDQVDVDTYTEEIETCEVNTPADVYRANYQAMATATGQASPGTFVTKTVLETEFFPNLREWFPDLKFIYVLRNPYAHFNAARNSIRADRARGESPEFNALKHPYPFIGSELRRMKGSYYFMNKFSELYPEHFYILSYDEILKNPEEQLRQLSDFLEISFNRDLLQPSICGEPWGGNSMHEDVFDGISKKPLTHWQQDTSDLEIRLINEFFADIIDEYDFEQLESNASILRRLHPSEWNPLTYVANRVIFGWGIENPGTF